MPVAAGEEINIIELTDNDDSRLIISMLLKAISQFNENESWHALTIAIDICYCW